MAIATQALAGQNHTMKISLPWRKIAIAIVGLTMLGAGAFFLHTIGSKNAQITLLEKNQAHTVEAPYRPFFTFMTKGEIYTNPIYVMPGDTTEPVRFDSTDFVVLRVRPDPTVENALAGGYMVNIGLTQHYQWDGGLAPTTEAQIAEEYQRVCLTYGMCNWIEAEAVGREVIKTPIGRRDDLLK